MSTFEEQAAKVVESGELPGVVVVAQDKDGESYMPSDSQVCGTLNADKKLRETQLLEGILAQWRHTL